MAKGKPDAAKAADTSAKKSKKPRFKGINHPRNVPKAFRSSGNGPLIRAALSSSKKRAVAQ